MAGFLIPSWNTCIPAPSFEDFTYTSANRVHRLQFHRQDKKHDGEEGGERLHSRHYHRHVRNNLQILQLMSPPVKVQFSPSLSLRSTFSTSRRGRLLNTVLVTKSSTYNPKTIQFIQQNDPELTIAESTKHLTLVRLLPRRNLIWFVWPVEIDLHRTCGLSMIEDESISLVVPTGTLFFAHSMWSKAWAEEDSMGYVILFQTRISVYICLEFCCWTLKSSEAGRKAGTMDKDLGRCVCTCTIQSWSSGYLTWQLTNLDANSSANS